MAITYAVGANIITITAGTEIAPNTFTDVYNADKAGTLSLHARVGIAAVDGAPIAVDRAERPTDYVVLGGISNDLYITVANWNLMTTATINIVGTDRDGAAQNENIVVNANGNYSTTKWFKTITHTQITVFTTPGGGTFDYDLIQGQWGVVWELGSDQFLFDARILLGAGAATWFGDEEKQVIFNPVTTAHWQYYIYVNNNATFRLGTVVDVTKKTTAQGCTVLFHSNYNVDVIRSNTSGVVLLYSSKIQSDSASVVNMLDPRANSRVWNTSFSGVRLAQPRGGDYYNVYIVNCGWGLAGVLGGTFDKITVAESSFFSILTYVTSTFTNIDGINALGMVELRTANGAIYLIDCTSDPDWDMWFTVTGPVYRQYSFDLKVVDGNGDGISGVTVSMDDINGNNVFSVATDGNGDIATQIVTYKTYDRAGGLPGVTDTEVTFSPHTVTVSKPGYSPRTIVYTMDRQREEIEKLAGVPLAIEYRRRRFPGEVSEMIEK